MRVQFYETAVLEELNGSVTLGVQVLTSPSDPVRDGPPEPIRYETILEDFDQVRALDSPDELHAALSLIADPTRDDFELEQEFELNFLPISLEAMAFATELMHEPLIPAEASPFEKRTLLDLAAIAGGSGFIAVTGGAPIVLLIGGGVGLVAIRGLEAVGGALWEGARPEVVGLGGDIGTKVVNWIRGRLGLKRRKPN